MIEQMDDKLKAWAEAVTRQLNRPDVRLSFDAPTDAEDGLAISMYLLEIVDDPRRLHTGRPKLQPSLRYLVTTRAGEAKDAHSLLGVLFYTALDTPDYEVELDPVDTHLWSAFGIAPRPAFILRMPMPHEFQLPPAPLVTQAPVPEIGAITTLYGLVQGPGAMPLAGAQVELPNLNRSTTVGTRGRFSLPGVQAAPAVKTLLISARGREKLVTTVETGSEDNPVIFPFEIVVTLYGQVARPDGSPLAGAKVEIAALQLSAAADGQGQFSLAGVPPAPAVKQLTIRSNGSAFDLAIQETGMAQSPVLLPFGACATLYGQVTQAGGQPLAGARVEIPAFQRVAFADGQGRFSLEAVPAAPVENLLTIRSGGQEQRVSTTETGLAGKPVVFTFNPDPMNKQEA